MGKHPAFTLFEMLCVLVIIAILLSLTTNGIANSVRWSRAGFEETVVADQLEQALDFIETDVRSAKAVDSAHWREPETVTRSYTLRLIVADSGDARKEGLVVYTLQASRGVYNEENPPERPDPRMVLYRAQEDSLHSGADQALAFYLNSSLDAPKGLEVTYYNANGAVCTLADEVTAVGVQLSGQTKDGVSVTRSRLIPMMRSD